MSARGALADEMTRTQIPIEFTPSEPMIKMQQKITVESTRKSLTTPRAVHKQQTATSKDTPPNARLSTLVRSELRNNPGRNILLLIAVLLDVKKLICYLVKTSARAFRIKKLSIHCKFGADDPFDTGQVAAVVFTSIYSFNYLREHRHIYVNFQPDFEKENFEFDGDAIILIKAMTALSKILGAILGALLKGVFYYGGKIAWRIGPDYFRKPKKSDIN